MKKSIIAILCAAMLAACTETESESRKLTIIAGTYTDTGSAGIYSLCFDTETGEAALIDSCRIANPSYLTISDDGTRIYAVSELEEGGGGAAAIAFDKDNGSFRLLNVQPAHGDSPCYISTNGQAVVTANYMGGSMSVFSIAADGSLEPVSAVCNGTAGGPDPERQATPHVHCAVFAPDDKHLYASDFSADRLLCFDVDGSSISPSLDSDLQQLSVPVASDSGPRHLIFNEEGTHAYLIGELSGAVTVFDVTQGLLTPKQTIDADPYDGRGSADIHLSPDGRFLYASNRLKGDGIAVFAVDGATGMLTEAGYCYTGPHPRHFNITPDGRWLLCACRDSNAIEIYELDPENGIPAATGRTIELRKPVCVQFVP